MEIGEPDIWRKLYPIFKFPVFPVEGLKNIEVLRWILNCVLKLTVEVQLAN
jgi:hypothetical protein